MHASVLPRPACRRFRLAVTFCLAFCVPPLLAPVTLHAQTADEKQQLAGTQSIGDAVRLAEQSAASHIAPRVAGTAPPAAIHILYVHGINQIGPGDSAMLRASICRYLHACEVHDTGRIYAEGPFAIGAPPPSLAYMNVPIWTTSEQWSASAPFIERYEISSGGHAPILVDELNWYPIVYPIKCRWLIARDAALTGPDDAQIKVCEAAPQGTQADPAHPGRFLQYQWIANQEGDELEKIHRRATFLNRDMKNGLMDWGFGDAVMALGDVQQLLTVGIRELLDASLTASGVDLHITQATDSGPEAFFVTHSLGSYLSLTALDADWLGPAASALPQFAITPEEKSGADYFSAHTAGFYFLANQVGLLELANIAPLSPTGDPPQTSAPAEPVTGPCPAPGTQAPSPATPKPDSIEHWQALRQQYLARHALTVKGPQIVAWNDPDDLLTWRVPCLASVRVVNLRVRNAGFKIPPFFVWPLGAHDNYAENRKVFRVIFSPTAE
ncbi:MAG TPA: hypothetical protein VMD92_01330 [Acidobacteriaceae bacterium]|nr:hypothetical protein [Acidobacteriaceae bacterium]